MFMNGRKMPVDIIFDIIISHCIVCGWEEDACWYYLWNYHFTLYCVWMGGRRLLILYSPFIEHWQRRSRWVLPSVPSKNWQMFVQSQYGLYFQEIVSFKGMLTIKTWNWRKSRWVLPARSALCTGNHRMICLHWSLPLSLLLSIWHSLNLSKIFVHILTWASFNHTNIM